MLACNERIYGVGVLDDNVLTQRGTFLERLIKALHIKEPFVFCTQEKRQVPRFGVSIPVSYRIENEFNGKVAKSLELSETGIRIAINHRVKKGTKIDLEMKLPNLEDNLKIRGVIVWTKPSINISGYWECGVSFQNLRQVGQKEKLISLLADQHCRFVLMYTKEYVAGSVDNFEDSRAIFKVLYKEYRKRQLCSINPWQMHYTHFSLLPTTQAFQIKHKEKLFGTISLIGDSAFGLPMEATYPEVIKKLRIGNRKIAEVGFLALDSSQFKKNFFSLTHFQKQAILFKLYKVMFDYACFILKATDLIIGIHPRHEMLYKYLQFRVIAGGRPHSGAEGNNSLLLHMDIPQVIERNLPLKSGPGVYFLRNPAPMDVLNKKMEWNHDTLLQLLLDRKALWGDLTPNQRERFDEIYPGLIKAVKAHQEMQIRAVPENIIIESCKSLINKALWKKWS